jgi:hypothetical protein
MDLKILLHQIYSAKNYAVVLWNLLDYQVSLII